MMDEDDPGPGEGSGGGAGGTTPPAEAAAEAAAMGAYDTSHVWYTHVWYADLRCCACSAEKVGRTKSREEGGGSAPLGPKRPRGAEAGKVICIINDT